MRTRRTAQRNVSDAIIPWRVPIQAKRASLAVGNSSAEAAIAWCCPYNSLCFDETVDCNEPFLVSGRRFFEHNTDPDINDPVGSSPAGEVLQSRELEGRVKAWGWRRDEVRPSVLCEQELSGILFFASVRSALPRPYVKTALVPRFCPLVLWSPALNLHDFPLSKSGVAELSLDWGSNSGPTEGTPCKNFCARASPYMNFAQSSILLVDMPVLGSRGLPHPSLHELQPCARAEHKLRDIPPSVA